MTEMVYSLITAGLCLLMLSGVVLLCGIKTAKAGNAVIALGMLLAILLTLYRNNMLDDIGLWVALAAGLALGALFSLCVKMIRVPQALALLSGLGGGSAAIVGLTRAINPAGDLAYPVFSAAAAALSVAMGTLALTGGVIAALKPQRQAPQKPAAFKGHAALSIMLLVLSIAAVVFSVVNASLPLALAPCAFFSALFGALLAIRAGGAELPVTISLLGTFAGVAVGVAGVANENLPMVVAGGIAASGALALARIMCHAMNRRLFDILLGKPRTARLRDFDPESAEKEITPEDIRQLVGRLKNFVISTKEPSEDVSGEVDALQILRQARSVVFVPGHGMAISKAQAQIKALADALESFGIAVKYGIHPAAGRVPGHVNVLLAEVGVPYGQLFEMEKINAELSKCDVCIVVGANDVINPAANTAKGTPIYGMPIVNVTLAKHLILCNLDKKPGCAGVENPLYRHAPNVTLMLGDAKASLEKLRAELGAGGDQR